MFLIKLGGSVITEKAQEKPIFKKNLVDEIVSTISTAQKDVVIVHGAGSFGHVLAKQHDLINGCNSLTQKQGFAETLGLVQELNSFVLASFHDHNLPAISLPPHALVTLKNKALHTFNSEIFVKYADAGFIPVTFGDVVLDVSLGCSICSGDLLIHALAQTFKPEAVLFLMDEDGLYTDNPKKNKDATFINSIGIHEIDSLVTDLDDHADVTKGMEGKLQTITQIVEQGRPTVLLNGNKPDRLYDVLQGNETICTIVHR
jgi:isopentenyl phosphate kinase